MEKCRFCLVIMRTLKSREKALAERMISACPAFAGVSQGKFFSTEKSKILSRTFILPSSIKAPKQWSARAHWEHENFFRGNLLFAENFRRTNQTGHRRNWRGANWRGCHVAAIWDCEWFAYFFSPPWNQPWPNRSAIWRHPCKAW